MFTCYILRHRLGFTHDASSCACKVCLATQSDLQHVVCCGDSAGCLAVTDAKNRLVVVSSACVLYDLVRRLVLFQKSVLLLFSESATPDVLVLLTYRRWLSAERRLVGNTDSSPAARIKRTVIMLCGYKLFTQRNTVSSTGPQDL